MAALLMKADDALISFCRCDSAYATQGQMSCPWCGCGWLFTCATCRRAFTFAESVAVDVDPHDVARNSIRAMMKTDVPSDDMVERELEWMTFWAGRVPRGERVVFLDGHVLAADTRPVAFEGWHARHAMDALPHAAAVHRKEIDDIFGQPDYWQSRQLEAAQ